MFRFLQNLGYRDVNLHSFGNCLVFKVFVISKTKKSSRFRIRKRRFLFFRSICNILLTVFNCRTPVSKNTF